MASRLLRWTKSLGLHLPCRSFLLIQAWALEVRHLCRAHRVVQISISRGYVETNTCHLLKLFPRSVEKRLFYLEAKLLKEVNFLVIQVFFVEDRQFLHAGFHLGTLARVLLE